MFEGQKSRLYKKSKKRKEELIAVRKLSLAETADVR
jgi:hypothetical protein